MKNRIIDWIVLPYHLCSQFLNFYNLLCVLSIVNSEYIIKIRLFNHTLHTVALHRKKLCNMSVVCYWVPQKLPQIYTLIAYICIGKVAWFAVYICIHMKRSVLYITYHLLYITSHILYISSNILYITIHILHMPLSTPPCITPFIMPFIIPCIIPCLRMSQPFTSLYLVFLVSPLLSYWMVHQTTMRTCY